MELGREDVDNYALSTRACSELPRDKDDYHGFRSDPTCRPYIRTSHTGGTTLRQALAQRG